MSIVEVIPPDREDTPNRVVESGSLNDFRRVRLARRQASSVALISAARIEAGLAPVAPAGTTAESAEWVRPPRPARCRWRVSETVAVHHDGEVGQPAHFSGLERCASIWACPVCSAVIRGQRANDIQSAVEAHQKTGGGLAMVTLTLKHTRADTLAENLDIAIKGWQRMVAGRAWQDFKASHGVVGFVRSVEITHGRNGWHPHIHVLLFMGERAGKNLPSHGERPGNWFYNRWSKIVQRLGGRIPSEAHGVDFRSVDDHGRVAARYISKVQDEGIKPEPKISAEIARGDIKDGRQDSRMPFQFLDGHGANPGQDLALWNEYVKATRGRRAITWSRGLRELYLTEPEKTDDELIEETEAQAPVYLMPGNVWDRRFRDHPSSIAVALETVELGELEVLHLLADSSGEMMPDLPGSSLRRKAGRVLIDAPLF